MKKIIALLLALAMVMSLAACGGSSEPTATEAPVAPEAAELLEQLFPSRGPLLEINK